MKNSRQVDPVANVIAFLHPKVKEAKCKLQRSTQSEEDMKKNRLTDLEYNIRYPKKPFSLFVITRSVFNRAFLTGKLDDLVGFSGKGLNANGHQDFLLSVLGTMWSDVSQQTDAELSKTFTMRIKYDMHGEGTKTLNTLRSVAAKKLAESICANANEIASIAAVEIYFKSTKFKNLRETWKSRYDEIQLEIKTRNDSIASAAAERASLAAAVSAAAASKAASEAVGLTNVNRVTATVTLELSGLPTQQPVFGVPIFDGMDVDTNNSCDKEIEREKPGYSAPSNLSNYSQTDSDDVMETGAAAVPEPKMLDEPLAEPEPVSLAEAEPESKPIAEPKAEPQPAFESLAQPEVEPDPESEAFPEPQAEPEPAFESLAGPEAEPEPESEALAEPGAESLAEPEAELSAISSLPAPARAEESNLSGSGMVAPHGPIRRPRNRVAKTPYSPVVPANAFSELGLLLAFKMVRSLAKSNEVFKVCSTNVTILNVKEEPFSNLYKQLDEVGFRFYTNERKTGDSAGDLDTYCEVKDRSRAQRIAQASGVKNRRFRSGPELKRFWERIEPNVSNID